jgi:hypothetical protein
MQKVSSIEEARKDVRFTAAAMKAAAPVKVLTLIDRYSFYGISNNGCGLGKTYVSAELVSPFDGMPAGTPIVVRIKDSTLGPSLAGSTVAFSGLRRAGKAPDGTFVYCGTGAVANVRHSAVDSAR